MNINSPTPKIFETGAMKVEAGLYLTDGALQSDGWGDTDSAQVLGAGDAFPWLSFGTSVAIATEEDASVTTKAFMASPRIIGKTIENGLSFSARFTGLNRFHYWMWGFENVTMSVVAFKGSTTTDPWGENAPDVGDVYLDDAVSYTYLRTEKIRNDKIYVFANNDVSAVPTVAGTLEMNSGEKFTFTSNSAQMYEHLYELDSSGRRYRRYTDAEISVFNTEMGAGTLDSDDARNLMCTLAKRMSNYDLRYANSMSKSFNYKISAAGLAQWETTYMAFLEERGDFSSEDWTLTDGLCNNQLVPSHYEMRFAIGENLNITNGEITGLTDLGLTDFDMAVETPMQSLQDFESGLSIAEPVLEGAYKVTLNGTISRHTVQTYQGFRDEQNVLVGHLVTNQNWYMQEMLFKEITIQEAGPDDGDVAAEPLKMTSSFVCAETNAFTAEWLYGHDELQDSPVVFRVRDFSSQNQMILS
jgi:hypothetical protein